MIFEDCQSSSEDWLVVQCSWRVGLELSSVCAQALTVSILQDSMVGIPSNCALISADSNLLNDNMAVCLPPYLYFGDFACLENAKLELSLPCRSRAWRCQSQRGQRSNRSIQSSLLSYSAEPKVHPTARSSSGLQINQLFWILVQLGS